MPTFKLALNIDNVAAKPPLELAPGWEAAEIPITELLLPYDPEETWKAKLAEIRTWNQPPFTAASHFIKNEMVSGPNQAPFEELERQAEQNCRRLAELAPNMVAGIWGNFFPLSRRLLPRQGDRAGRALLPDAFEVRGSLRSA